MEDEHFLTGYLYKESRPRRSLNDRWYISINDYPYDLYPPYVTAGCFLMTRSNIRLFHFDDIYMGLLAYAMSINIISNNDLFSSYSSSAILFRNHAGVLSRWKTFFNNQINITTTVKPISIHGYRGEDVIHVLNDIH